jgi:HK97 gp10 family phage protein
VITVKTTDLGVLSKKLDGIAKTVQEQVLFSGAAAMAKVVYDEARANAPVSEKEHYFYGSSYKKTGQKYLFVPGTLRASIYRVYSESRSTTDRKTYQVSWNHTKAPYGYMVEFGTSRAPAHPFMRPAADRLPDAVKAGRERMKQRYAEVQG